MNEFEISLCNACTATVTGIELILNIDEDRLLTVVFHQEIDLCEAHRAIATEDTVVTEEGYDLSGGDIPRWRFLDSGFIEQDLDGVQFDIEILVWALDYPQLLNQAETAILQDTLARKTTWAELYTIVLDAMNLDLDLDLDCNVVVPLAWFAGEEDEEQPSENHLFRLDGQTLCGQHLHTHPDNAVFVPAIGSTKRCSICYQRYGEEMADKKILGNHLDNPPGILNTLSDPEFKHKVTIHELGHAWVLHKLGHRFDIIVHHSRPLSSPMRGSRLYYGHVDSKTTLSYI